MAIAGDVDAVEKLVREKVGEVSAWDEPVGYPESLALCAIDAVYSLRSHYTAAIHVLDRYRAYRREQGGDPATDGASELLAAIREAGVPQRPRMASSRTVRRLRVHGVDGSSRSHSPKR